VAFRQDVGGRSRTLMRRLRGSTFDAALALDAGATSGTPGLAMNPIGEGIALSVVSGTAVYGSLFADDDVIAPARLDATASMAAPEPVASFSDRGDGAIAYRTQAADGSSIVRGRLLPAGKPEAEVALSLPAAGPVVAGSLRADGDRVGDVVVAMLQQAPAGRSLTVALQDIPPARPVPSARAHFLNPRTEGIAWNPGLDYLGPQRFRVRVDGRVIGETTGTRLRTTRVRDGRHRLQIVAIDLRGQQTSSRSATMYVDTRKPRARVTASRAGKLVALTVHASDPGRSGSGVRSLSVDWGDGHRSASRTGQFRHRYRTSGRKRITVTVRDRARNENVKRLRR
jgi:hypothetical protein